jgi:hypothetical protein
VINYFVYKVGTGNCWLPLADDHGLYVGFSDSEEPNATLPPIGVRATDPTFQGLTGKDDDNIAWLTDPANQSKALILVFDDVDLLVFRPAGRVEIHRNESPAHDAARAHHTKKPLRFSDYSELFQGGDRPTIFKTLPVRKIATIPRSSLYTSVDSLSVYQALNRGTCRRLWRTKGPTDGVLPDAVVSRAQGGAQGGITSWGGSHLGVEEPFAAFVRLYLNEVIARATTEPVYAERMAREPKLADVAQELGERGFRLLALATMNPILVETAAFYLCLDLGLLPDVGVGKGFEGVDIRARFEPGRAWHAERLASLRSTPGVRVTDACVEAARAAGCLQVQCKASEKKGVGSTLLYFGYGSRGERHPNTVFLPDLDRLLDGPEWRDGLLARFVNMQAAILADRAAHPPS